jgi:hypothetical protein
VRSLHSVYQQALSVAVILVTFCAVVIMASATVVMAQSQSGAPFIPTGLVEIERGSRTLDEIAAGFPSPNEAAHLLTAWGFQGNAYFNYAGSTRSGTTSLEISFHLFASPASATEALSYYAAGRALMLGFSPVPVGRIGDQILAIGGVRDVGNELTIYLRQGSLLVRVSAVAPVGDPSPDAIATAQGIVQQMTLPDVTVTTRSVDTLLPSVWNMPPGFMVSDEGIRTVAEVADTFLRPAEAIQVLSAAGLRENVFRYFVLPTGAGDYPGAATSIQVSLHLFDTRAGAFQALPYYADGRAKAIGPRVVQTTQEIGDGAIVLQGPAPGGPGVEVTVYVLLGNVLARISAVSPGGAPTADALATALFVASLA